MSRVGSLAVGVAGSSDGWSTMPPSIALTKPWFEITVPSITLGSTTTSKVIVATLSGDGGASAGIAPGVGSRGALISMPATSGDVPPTSATGAPFRVVLPAT